MRKSIPWIWLAILLMAAGLWVTGCGKPSQAGSNLKDQSDAESSSNEVAAASVLSPETAVEAIPENASIQQARGEELDRREAELAAREAELEAQTRALDRPAAPTRADAEETADRDAEDLIPIDRFRAIPIEREREATPEVRYREVSLVVPAGTTVQVEFLDGLSSEESRIGDRFVTQVVESVTVDGYFAIPAGAEIHGRVVDVQPVKKIGGQARLALELDRLHIPSGEEIPIRTSLYQEGRNETKRDAATIGGAAAAGVLIGRAVKSDKKGKGGTIGALIGAAIGAGIAAKTPGEPVTIPRGELVTLILDEALPLTVRVRVVES